MPAVSVFNIDAGNPQAVGTGETSIAFETTINTLKAFKNGATLYELVEKDATQTLTNKAITSTAPVNITSATVTLSAATHGGRLITLNRAAGIAVTLPAATGSGVQFTLHVGTTFTGASTVKVANASDVMQGTAILFADAGDTVVGFATGATADTIDLLGTSNSTGGIFGATIVLVDSATNIWSVRYVSDAGGTEATPFSATV